MTASALSRALSLDPVHEVKAKSRPQSARLSVRHRTVNSNFTLDRNKL